MIGLVEAEDLKPNDLVGVNKEPTSHVCWGGSIMVPWVFAIVVGDKLMDSFLGYLHIYHMC